jgi:hypothetical protein
LTSCPTIELFQAVEGLAAAEGQSDVTIAERFSVNRKTVILWRSRFSEKRLEAKISEVLRASSASPRLGGEVGLGGPFSTAKTHLVIS